MAAGKILGPLPTMARKDRSPDARRADESDPSSDRPVPRDDPQNTDAREDLGEAPGDKKSARERRVRDRRRSKPKREKSPPKGVARFFLRGLVTLAPVVLTIVVFGLLYQMVDKYVTSPINSVIYWSLEKNSLGWKALEQLQIDPLSFEYLDEQSLPIDTRNQNQPTADGISPAFITAVELHRAEHHSFFKSFDDLAIDGDKLRTDVAGVVHPVVGIVLSLLLVLWLGWLVGGYMGRHIVARVDQAMHAIPGVRSVYPYSKQLVEFFFAEKKLDFDTVICIPYPSPGLWSIGFVTSSSLKTLREETGERMIGVFIPSSPMPMTGYTIFVAYDQVIPLPISVDEALRITMTGGVLVPPREKVDDPLLDEWEQVLPVVDDAPAFRMTEAAAAEDPSGREAALGDSDRGDRPDEDHDRGGEGETAAGDTDAKPGRPDR